MKWIWIILTVFLCSGCGWFKKLKHTEEFNHELKSYTSSEIYIQDSINRIKHKSSYFQTVRKYTPVKDSTGKITSVLTEETTTEFKESKSETKRNRNIKAKKSEKKAEKDSARIIDKEKESNTTLQANLPWWIWLIGFGAAYLLTKKAL